MYCRFIIIFICVVLIYMYQSERLTYKGCGGAISPREGPVDMLQTPKQLLMDGYRFQDALFPPIEINNKLVIDHQRIGIFKDKAYIDQEGGHEGASLATIAQMKSRGDQDKYILGHQGEPFVDSEKPFGHWVRYGSPEITHPNKVFSWGDVLFRYRNEKDINI